MDKWYIERNNKINEFYRMMIEKKRSLCPGSQNLYQDIEMSEKSVQFNIDISYRSDAVDLHNHTFYEGIYVVSGYPQYMLSNRRYELRPGDLIWIPPGVNHCPVLSGLEGGNPYERYVIWIDQAFMKNMQATSESMLEELNESRILFFPPEEEKHIAYLLRHGYETQKSEKPMDLLERKALASLLVVLTVRCLFGHEKKRTPHEDIFDRINEFIIENLAEDISIVRITEKFGISKQSLSDLFRKTTGMTVHQWITRRRLLHAKSLLASGCQPTKIWADCGFLDYSGFYRAFVRLYGISPKEYAGIALTT